MKPVRILRTDDVPLLTRLHAVTFPADALPDLGLGAWWIANAADKPVGLFGLHPVAPWSDTGYIVRVGVSPTHRGAGLQKRMTRVAEAHARRLGWNWIITDCRRDNYASANSLMACGFRLYEPVQRWGFADALYWRKQITKGTP